MNVSGERILIFGDSLSHPGQDLAPTLQDVTQGSGRLSSAPGDLLGSLLLEAGASAVRIDAKVGRSAVSFFGNEPSAQLLSADRDFKPSKVIVMLGTNDAERDMVRTGAALIQLRDFYRSTGAEVWAIGPMTYVGRGAGLNAKADQVFTIMQRVFGTDRTIDARPLSATEARAGDGIHFTPPSAAATALAIATTLLAKKPVRIRPIYGALFGVATVAVIGLVVLAVKHRRPALAGPDEGERPKRGMFPTPRERAEDYLHEGKFKMLRTIKPRKGPELEIWGTKGGSYSIRRADTLEEVGTAYVAEKWDENGRHQGQADYLSIVRVNPAYRRQGVATALYDTIEKHTGQKLRPSPTDQSDDAKAFWAKRKPLGSTDDEDEDNAPDWGEDPWFQRIQARRDKKVADVEAALATSPALIVSDGYREYLLITSGEMQEGHRGKFRVTTFADDGPMGHDVEPTMHAIAKEIAQHGYKTVRPATDDDVMTWTTTPKFVEGSKRVAFVQAVNALSSRAHRKGNGDAAREVEQAAHKLAAEGDWDGATALLQRGIKDLGQPRLRLIG